MAKGRKMNGRYSEWDQKFESDQCACHMYSLLSNILENERKGK